MVFNCITVYTVQSIIFIVYRQSLRIITYSYYYGTYYLGLNAKCFILIYKFASHSANYYIFIASAIAHIHCILPITPHHGYHDLIHCMVKYVLMHITGGGVCLVVTAVIVHSHC